jgi:hypothetical protein
MRTLERERRVVTVESGTPIRVESVDKRSDRAIVVVLKGPLNGRTFAVQHHNIYRVDAGDCRRLSVVPDPWP